MVKDPFGPILKYTLTRDKCNSSVVAFVIVVRQVIETERRTRQAINGQFSSFVHPEAGLQIDPVAPEHIPMGHN